MYGQLGKGKIQKENVEYVCMCKSGTASNLSIQTYQANNQPFKPNHNMPTVIRLVKSRGYGWSKNFLPIVEVWSHNFTHFPSFRFARHPFWVFRSHFKFFVDFWGRWSICRRRCAMKLTNAELHRCHFHKWMSCSPMVLWNKKAIGENSCIRQLVYLPFNLCLFAFTDSSLPKR